MSKETLFSRILLLILCALIASVCFWHLNQSYDPLARYPYATEKNRKIILKYLDGEDIDYMISQQLRPKYYMDFIKEKDFDIHQTLYYYTAKTVNEESNPYIVNFINKYNSYFTRDDLEHLLKHYSYLDLTTFYENDKTAEKSVQLATDPSDPFLILDSNTTVYKYVPSDMRSDGDITVKSEMNDDLKDMQQTYISMMGAPALNIESGYKSYDECIQYNDELEKSYSKKILKQFVRAAGQNEYQLGYTICIEGHSTWVTSCLQHTSNNEVDYSSVMNTMSDSQKSLIVWLEENAYHFGFIIRYPEGATSTNMAYQPFVLRYVGKEAAKDMHTSKKTMEETDFSDMEM